MLEPVTAGAKRDEIIVALFVNALVRRVVDLIGASAALDACVSVAPQDALSPDGPLRRFEIIAVTISHRPQPSPT